ncbi:MAG TPA: D-Ala-D-Ala carboxypeptidase family metallohydrolase [Cyclobacteriaceae bacterium]|nr:D-Ala-D-Ala carboxypeptidase family metallohydrolase [Cyclobacteriaceae bacterium]
MNSTTEHLSKYLTLQDAIKARPGFSNKPSEDQIKALIYWGTCVLDPIVEHFGVVPFLHSVFRNDAYNAAIGGDPHSQHRFGQAGDMDFDNVPKAPNNKALFDFVVRNLNFDQIIWEKGTNENPDWVHVSAIDGVNRKKITQCVVVEGKTCYKPFDLYKFPTQ